MKHILRGRPQGHLQCTECRAGFLHKESARRAQQPCYEQPLPHGHRYDREHVVYPTWYDQGNGHGPDRLCDEPGCICVQHTCDCDVCTEQLQVPVLNILNDSQEGQTGKRDAMSHEIETHLPAALRKYVVRHLECETQGQVDLMTACKNLDMGNSNNSAKIRLTNDALGALLDICREWKANSTNGAEVMAWKSVLTRHELDYQPEDPRQRRHEFKMPGSLASGMPGQYWTLKDNPEILADLEACTWAKNGGSGRVTYATLGWLLDRAKSYSVHGTGAAQRAGTKFLDTYTEAYEETVRLVNGYLEAADDEPAEAEVIEDQAPAADVGQESAEGAAPVQAGKSEVGPVPENFVWMAEHADTETARAWWARRVASWGR
ncbi:hypothetical protein [Kitasatospora sp. NPDC001095]